MATQKYEAVFHDGAFHLTQPVPAFAEGQRVRLVVEVRETPGVLDLAAQVYAGLSVEEVDEVEKIALERPDFFKRSGL